MLNSKFVIFPISFMHGQTSWLPVWLSGNALVSINVVTLRQARLVPGWVTVLGRVTTSVQNEAPRSTQPEPSLHG